MASLQCNELKAMSPSEAIRLHCGLLGHEGLGVTELRVFTARPQVAYADSVDVIIQLCREIEPKRSGIYIGVQPRPAHLFDLAPNRWAPARGGHQGNCGRDGDIEYINAAFFDIDVLSPKRREGYPASEKELEQTLSVAKQVVRQNGLGLESVICCSGNGHYVLVSILPVPVDSDEVARKFKRVCGQLASRVAGRFPGVRIDCVYNLSRVMRVMGTWNRKGQPLRDRPHRRAGFITEPTFARSVTLHHEILNTDLDDCAEIEGFFPAELKCDLARIEACRFIHWCRRHASDVSEPSWFAMLTNLAWLEGGAPLAHEISALDPVRYDRDHTQRVIDRILREGYKPVQCRTIMDRAMIRPGRGVFRCSRIGKCPVKAPMYMTAFRTDLQESGECYMNSNTNKRPTRVFRCGPITATVWIAPQVKGGKVVDVPSIKIDRSYESDGQRKYTSSFFVEDLPRIALVTTEAFKYLKLRSIEPDEFQHPEHRDDGGPGRG